MTKVLKIIVLILSIFIFYVICRVYLADIYYKKSIDMLDMGYLDKSLDYVDTSISLNKYLPEYYRGRAKLKIVMLTKSNNKDSKYLKESAYEDMSMAINLNNRNLVTLRNLVPLYYFLSVDDINKPVSKDNLDSQYLSKTLDYYSDLKTKYPNDVGVIVLISKYEKKLGLESEYQESLDIIKNLRPDLLEWHEDLRGFKMKSLLP